MIYLDVSNRSFKRPQSSTTHPAPRRRYNSRPAAPVIYSRRQAPPVGQAYC